MSFLQPILLYALPLALLPIIIHLINQHRHRTVQWAAMMFLLDAKKLTKGMARLRQFLILAMRVLAIAALVFAAGRPLASGWVALTAGGAPETVIILLDRSASMEEQNLETGESKRSTALGKIQDLLEKTAQNSEIILIDSATETPIEVTSHHNLTDLPKTGPTDTTADINSLLLKALDYITTNQTGRTDVWIASDLRSHDWNAAGNRWDTVRTGFSALEGVRLYLLNYPKEGSSNAAVSVSRVKRIHDPDGYHLLLDLDIRRVLPEGASPEDSLEIPVEFTLNGTRTAEQVTVTGDHLSLSGYQISLGNGEPQGWGKIEIPADGNPQDNVWHFVFNEEPVQKTVIITDNNEVGRAIQTAAAAPVDSNLTYDAQVLSTSQIGEIPWTETALLFWNADLPAPDSPEAAQLTQFVRDGKSLVLLPPPGNSNHTFLDFSWGDWVDRTSDPEEITWWRTDSELLANTQNGEPLPLGDLRVFRFRSFAGDAEWQHLLKGKNEEPLVARLLSDLPGAVYLWGTLPTTSHSSLAVDGVAFFVMVHRALQLGSQHVSSARFADCREGALNLPGTRTVLDSPTISTVANSTGSLTSDPALLTGAFSFETSAALNQEKRHIYLALNRPVEEDAPQTVSPPDLEKLLAGLDYQIIKDEVGNNTSLASEIWRAFLVAMALALLIEAALCVPPRQTDPVGFQTQQG